MDLCEKNQLYPRVKHTAHKVIHAFQCWRWRQRLPRKKLVQNVLAPGGWVRRVPGGTGGAASAPGASGQRSAGLGSARRPDNLRPRQQPRHQQSLGLQGQPRAPSEALHLIGLFRRISLRVTHAGESVWMERRSTSRGPEAGSPPHALEGAHLEGPQGSEAPWSSRGFQSEGEGLSSGGSLLRLRKKSRRADAVAEEEAEAEAGGAAGSRSEGPERASRRWASCRGTGCAY